jgi:hypothetical protein
MNSRVSGAIPVCLLLFAPDAAAQDAVDLAARLIGRPYVWGAEGPRQFDCSGLTQYVYEQVGVELPRQAIQQSTAGDAAGRRLQRGDLLFFSTDTRRSVVTHVGLYEGNGVMIDASKRHGRVRRDDLSDRYWAERFMFARRVDSSAAIPDRSTRRARAPDLRRETTIRVLKGVADILLERRRR